MNKNLTTITLFKNGEKEIYLKAKDVAKMLGYENTNKAIKDHVCDEFIIEYKDFPGGNESLPLQPHTKFLLEPGFYQIALSSKLQSAKNFQKWVIKDVIPTLRKTGKYEIKTPLEILQSINYSDIEKLENGEYWKYKNKLKEKVNDVKIEYHVNRGRRGGKRTQENIREMKLENILLHDEVYDLYDKIFQFEKDMAILKQENEQKDRYIEKLKEEKLYLQDESNKLDIELFNIDRENEQQKRDIVKLQEQVKILFDLLDK